MVVYDQLTPLDVRDWQEKQATAALLSGANQHQPPGMVGAAGEGLFARTPVRGGPGPGSGGGASASGPGRAGAGELAGMDLDTLLAGVGPSGSQMEMGAVVRGPLAKEVMPKRIFAKSAQGPEEQA